MKLRNKTDGTIWKVIGGGVLPMDKVKSADITGSFLTLQSEETGAEMLYIHPYYADGTMEIMDGPVSEAVIEVTAKRVDQDELAPLLAAAQVAAIESGVVAGMAREKDLTNEGISIIVNTTGDTHDT